MLESEQMVIVETEIDEDAVSDEEFEENMQGIHLDLFGQFD